MKKRRLIIRILKKKIIPSMLIIFMVVLLLLSYSHLIYFTIVVSDSMRPTFSAGDILISKTVNDENIVIGDIITFMDRQGKIVTHRVVDIETHHFITKGDSVSYENTEYIAFDSLRYKYLFHVPFVGYAVQWINSLIGLVFFFITPLCYLTFIIFKKYSPFNKKTYKRYKPQEF
ncbi:signal peptidase I [Sutcliffiella horikoshii]|uniref:Signal peptidase I n=1 Tax=Sutcliffiella horikoshii TaxID=79883 RepID=A0A5D4TC18_9BACI|nr:signal peptidase I [Sutcliffiella horikoshii]TYS72278.1 signal peptidase I [Sutcliffiella horikoshii]